MTFQTAVAPVLPPVAPPQFTSPSAAPEDAADDGCHQAASERTVGSGTQFHASKSLSRLIL